MLESDKVGATKSRTALILAILAFNAQGASLELSERAQPFGDRIEAYVERSDMVVIGYFEGLDGEVPPDGVGGPYDTWDMLLVPLQVLVQEEGVSPPVRVKVRNDILPYRDWNVSRKQVRLLKESGFSELVRRYAELTNMLAEEHALGNVSTEELDSFVSESDRVLDAQTDLTTAVSPTVVSQFEQVELLNPHVPYLMFLERDGEKFKLLDEEYGFNLFFGVDALLFKREVLELIRSNNGLP